MGCELKIPRYLSLRRAFISSPSPHQADIDDKEKYGRNLGGSSESVFDGGVFWKKFRRQIGIGDIFVMGWELLRDKAVCK
jgi:hypothetical protein